MSRYCNLASFGVIIRAVSWIFSCFIFFFLFYIILGFSRSLLYCFGFVGSFCIIGVDVSITSGVLEDIVTLIVADQNSMSLLLSCGSLRCWCFLYNGYFLWYLRFWCLFYCGNFWFSGGCFNVSSGGILSIQYSCLFFVFCTSWFLLWVMLL